MTEPKNNNLQKETVNPPRLRSNRRQSQWQIALGALRIIFLGKLTLEKPRGKSPKIQVRTGEWHLERLEECIAFLERRTGLGKDVDPFGRKDESAWVIVSRLLSQEKEPSGALNVAYRFVEICYRLQGETSTRLDKSEALYWFSELLREAGDPEKARGAILLAYVESLEARSSRIELIRNRMWGEYQIPNLMLQELSKFVSEFPGEHYFPEQVMLRWELETVPRLSNVFPKRPQTRRQ